MPIFVSPTTGLSPLFRALGAWVCVLSLSACTPPFEDDPPSWMPGSSGPASQDTGAEGDGVADETADDGPTPCMPGAQDCACVPGGVCTAGLICDEGICLPCTDCAECGNGSCDVAQGESCASCPAECGACDACGDGTCDPDVAEDCSTCPADCGVCDACGDGTCDAERGEDCFSCAADCEQCPASCGDGECNGGERCATCPGDCECPPPPPTDPCADDPGGWWCGESIGGIAGTLYTCSGGVTTNTQPCANGCAFCPPGVPDVCRAFAGQTDDQACNPAECTDVDQSACNEYQTCVNGSCTDCPAGMSNCDGDGACECGGYCGGGGFCCTADNCAVQPQCQIC